MKRYPENNTPAISKTEQTESTSVLLWTKRGWMVCFTACLMAAFLLCPFNWIWLAGATVLLVLALDAHERLRAAKGEVSRWRDVFDWEDGLTAWLNKRASNKREGE
ncbi:TPA: hypothetical protein U2L33_006004 [Burkholderia cenocepacia]|nr:hypothetical protein [Burkholderia cenocepacia]